MFASKGCQGEGVSGRMLAEVIEEAVGQDDRITMPPDSIIVPLRQRLEKVSLIHKKDLARGLGFVHVPYRFDSKYPAVKSPLDV